MVAEPFSLTAAGLGVLATTFTAVTVAGRTIYKASHEAKSWYPKILAMQQRLSLSIEKVNSLQTKFTLNTDRKEGDYKYIYGQDSEDQLASMLSTVNKCMSAATKSLAADKLKIPDTKNACTPSTFADWAQSDSPGRSSSPWSKWTAKSFFKKAVFALVTCDELESMVGSVERQIDGLESLIEMRFNKLPDLAPKLVKKGDANRREFLEALLNLRDNTLVFGDWMNALLREAEKASMTCYVVPRPVDDTGYFHRHMDGGRLIVAFQLQTRRKKSKQASAKLQQATPSEESPEQSLESMQRYAPPGM